MKVEEILKLSTGGYYLKIANGFQYVLRLNDVSEAKEVQKTFEGKPSGTKFQWDARVVAIRIPEGNEKIVDYLQMTQSDKVEAIRELKMNTDYIVELPQTGSKALAEFIVKNKITTSTLFTMERTGGGKTTKYVFSMEGDQ